MPQRANVFDAACIARLKRGGKEEKALLSTYDLITTMAVTIPTVLLSTILQAMALVGISNIRNKLKGMVKGNDEIEAASQRTCSLLERTSLCRIGCGYELWGMVEIMLSLGLMVVGEVSPSSETWIWAFTDKRLDA